MSNIKLKPCPFCGGEAHTRTNTAFDRLHKWTVECGTEGCMGFYGCSFFEHEAEAVAAWNQRYERTCRNISLKAHKGVFCCSECEIHVDIALMDSADDYLPPFCPECGARVVE